MRRAGVRFTEIDEASDITALGAVEAIMAQKGLLVLATIVRWVLASAPSPDARPLAEVVEIDGDVECLAADRLAARTALWSDRASVPPDARIHLTHGRDRLVLRIQGVSTAEVVREFAPPPARCGDVETAVAVTIAMALDTAAVEARLDAPTPRASSDAPPPDPIAPREPPPPVERAARAPSVWVGVLLGGSAGVMPRPAIEGVVDVDLRWRAILVRAAIDAGGAWGIPLGPATASAGRIGVRASACAPIDRIAWRVAICAGLAGGPWIARAPAISAPSTAVVGWLAGLVGLELGVRLAPRVELVVAGDTVLAAIHPTLVAHDAATGQPVASATPRVGGRGLVGIRVGLERPRARARDVGSVVRPPRRAGIAARGGGARSP